MEKQLILKSFSIKGFLSLSLLLYFFAINAQQTTFRIQYDVALFDLPGGIVQSPSGNFVFSGTNATFGTTGHVFQIDGNGVVIWSKAYSAGGLSTQISDVKNATGNQYIVTGGTGSGCLLIRLDNTGTVVWANRYRVSSSSGSSEYGNKVIQSSDGGFVVAGSVSRVDPDGAGGLAKQDSSKLFCMKVNSAGVLQWMRVFFVTTAFDDDDYLYDVAEVSDGYVFVGYTTVVAGDGQSDAVILKTDFSGNLQWARKWGGSNSEGGYAVINNGANEVILSGDDNARAFLLRVSTPNGGPSVTGTNSLYATGGFSALGSSLVKTIDNHFTIFGTRIGFTLVPPFLDFSAFILKTNSSSGAVLFSRTYNSGFISILPTGLQSTDTGYVMNSVSATIPPGVGAYDYGVVKTDKNGQQNAGSACPESSPTFTRSNYAPTLNAFTPTIVTTSSTNSISPGVADIIPTQNVVCLDVICTAPPMPTVTSSQNNICPGTQVQISASGSGANVTYKVYTVPSNGTSIGNAPLNVTPSTTTTYYVEASDNTNPPCVSPRGSVTVTVLPLPANPGTITGQNNPCPGSQNYSIGNVANATSYNWSVLGGGTITGGQGTTGITINWTTAGGPYTVSVTASNSCGNTSSTLQVNVQGPPNTPGAITGANPACPGNQTYSISAVSGATGYTWSLSGGGTINSGQGTTSIIVNWGTTPGSYTISVTANSLCGSSAAASLNVTVSPGPPAAPGVITGEVNPCPGSQNYSIASVTNATGYTWSLSGGGTITSGQNTTSIAVNWTTTGGPYTISVTANNSCGSSAPTTLGVNVQGPPNAPGVVSGEINPCPGNENYSISAVSGASTYTWSVSGGGTITGGHGTTGITINWATVGGPYTVSVTASNSCGNTSSTLQVNVKGVLNPPGAITGANPACPGNEAYAIAAVSGATGYTWNLSGGGTISNGQGTTSVTINWGTIPGNYTISVTANNLCGSSAATSLNVTVSPGPLAAPDTISGEVRPCPGPQNYSISQVTTATGYTWMVSSGGTITSGQNTTSIAIDWTTTGGPYTISVTANNSCGSSSPATLDVNVQSGPPNAPATVIGEINPCPGNENYSIAMVSGATTYNWSVSGGGTISSGQGTNIISVGWTQSGGPYTVSVTAENACGISAPATLDVNVKPGPPASPGTITGNTSICKGREVYSIASVPTATGYDWTVFSGGTILSGQGTISLTVDWTAPGTTNDISVTASNDCGTSTPSFLTVTILPDTPAIPGIINGNISVCPGPENYSIGAITGATTYNWSMSGGGTISAGQGSTNVTLNWATPGIYTISVSSSNLCGTSAARTLDVTVNPVPTLPNVMLSDDSICPGEAVIITASGSTGGTVSYNFYNNITGGNLLGTSPLTVNPNSTTTYYLDVSNEFGCKISGRVPVQVYVFTPPSGNITAPDKSVCFNDSATLTASSTGSNVVFTWWDNPNGGNLLGTGATYTTLQLQQNATYYVQMQSSDGCVSQTARATVEVTMIPTPLVELICDDPDKEIIAGQTVRFDALPDDLNGYEFFVNGVGVQTGSQSFYVTNSLRDYDTVSVLAIENGCLSERDSIIIRVREIANAFTPDGDGVNDLFLKDFELIILNRWGQELFSGIDGWDGTFKGRDVSPGTYYYIVTIKDATNKDRVEKGALMLIRN